MRLIVSRRSLRTPATATNRASWELRMAVTEAVPRLPMPMPPKAILSLGATAPKRWPSTWLGTIIGATASAAALANCRRETDVPFSLMGCPPWPGGMPCQCEHSMTFGAACPVQALSQIRQPRCRGGIGGMRWGGGRPPQGVRHLLLDGGIFGQGVVDVDLGADFQGFAVQQCLLID